MSHFVEICEFGRIHSQCRCASPNKERRTVICNNPHNHMREEEYQPKHRRDV